MAARTTHDLWRRCRRVLALVVLLICAAAQLGIPVAAQFVGRPRGVQLPDAQPVGPSETAGPADLRMEAKRIAALNTMRQKAMVSDADKLVQLAEKLQQDADAGETKMSPAERMHTASEIERLAKGVKEKMIYAIGTSAPIGPMSAWQH